MRPENREKREAQIVEAAYALLEEKGFDGVSMLGVARAAKASNETLYRWYGDKQGLFMALVARNVAELDAHLKVGNGELRDVLAGFGPALLGMLLGPRAIALNRAAATDSSGELGKALAIGGRDVVRPRLVDVMGTFHGEKSASELFAMAELYFTLLIGDLQIRRVTGVLPPLNPHEIQARSDAALETFLRIVLD
ncbi:TetR/AcrR family transcriptional regulator [Octadecabacter sp. 1_MG-2023]|uniref:TetR/AcrR family transcriptional regulator n=1 Tax=unclassified Octadecabacter TaxID=196158 RepID=UPI001C0804D5|nr:MULTISPECIES: TetR/AcrR family transcriptional regulator [unclassified Octadecabacter]MBU2992823.1 TetR/AcrR family transcriptional regulator [Octadecabacter sp. B2R22]MDO6733726.1 TetR/AcrR family transcriptional regulator [Octadecabacter sp. 1_MG-2023]